MSATGATARIGPNAIIQLAGALDARVGRGTTRRVFDAAGLAAYLEAPPQQMVVEGEVIALHTALRRALEAPLPERVARDAGLATGDYLLRHRIPAPVQRLLQLLPRRLASRVLLTAISRHAWTFAGSATFRATPGRRPVLTFADCPICRGARTAGPICDYYAGTFERLYRALVDPRTTVVETACAAAGAAACRFEIRWP